MNKKGPKQTGTQTVSRQMAPPSWLDSGYQNAFGAATNLFNSGGNPAVAQAQSAYDSALSRYNSSKGGGFDYANNLPSDYTGIKDAGGGAYQWRVNPGTWQGAEGAPMLTPGEIALYVNNRGGGGGAADRSEVDSALAALNAAKAQPWDQSQDPLWRSFSDATQEGMDNIMNLSRSGVNDNALNLYNRTLEGDFLYGGDAFNEAYGAASRRITPQVTSAFNAAGRMGGGAGADELGGQLGDAFAGLYNAERGRQQGALAMAPTMNALAYDPAMRQLQVGGMQDTVDYANKNIPTQRLNQYLAQLGAISPNYRDQMSTQPVYSQGGGLGSLIGTGLSLYGMATGSPLFGAAGGLLGGGGGVSTPMAYAPKSPAPWA